MYVYINQDLIYKKKKHSCERGDRGLVNMNNCKEQILVEGYSVKPVGISTIL